MNSIIGVGETVLDIIFKNDQPEAAVPGGSTFNAIISLGRAKIPCSIITEVGDDHVGDITCKYLRDNGVDDTYVHRRKGIKSHLSLAFLDEKNDAHYQFYKDHSNISIPDNIPLFDNTDFILYGSFYAINPVIRKQVKQLLSDAKEKGAFIYYDLNFRASHINDIPYVKENIIENYKLSTIVRGSLEDFGYLYGTNDVQDIYNKHISPYCKYFICTNGGEATWLFTPLGTKTYNIKSIETISTIGAGDNFNAGYIYALRKYVKNRDLEKLMYKDWDKLINTALLFSTDVCQQFGNSISPSFVERLLSDNE